MIKKVVLTLILILAGLALAFLVFRLRAPGVEVKYNPDYQETTYISRSDPTIQWIVYHSEINRGGVKLISSSVLPIVEQVKLHDMLLSKVMADTKGEFHTLFLGRLEYVFGPENKELSKRLMRAAQLHPSRHYDNGVVKELLIRNDVFREFRLLFKKYRLAAGVESVEKVLIDRETRLPFDCMVWMRIFPLSPR